jgi:hypothetical protein
MEIPSLPHQKSSPEAVVEAVDEVGDDHSPAVERELRVAAEDATDEGADDFERL